MLDQLLENVKNIRELEENAESYISEHFEGIKRRVEVRRQDLKLRIDKYSEELVRSVESTRLECIKSVKEVDWLTAELKRLNREISEFLERIELECESQVEREADIDSSAALLNDDHLKLLDDYQRLLVKNRKYTFEFADIPIKKVFGSLSNAKVSFINDYEFSSMYFNFIFYF